MDDRPSLAEILDRLLEETGYSQVQLARESGVSTATLSRWRAGKSVKPYHREGLLALAATFQLSRARTNQLLLAAGLPPIAALFMASARNEPMRELMARWKSTARNNLPAPLTSFIGREVELVDLAATLDQPGVRLVTLTGPGGSGKTRLAIEAALELLDVFADGVFFVSLAGLSSAEQVVPAVVQALGLGDAVRREPLDQLKIHLREQRVLLVLDNFEHVSLAARDVVALLESTPHVKVLVTSRVRLHVYGEYERAVPPLELPSPETSYAQIARNASVQLFVARATAANPRFALRRSSAADIARLCAWLDGLPLAIELAAARARDYTPEDLLAQFTSRLDLASDGPRDVQARQRTLRAAIAWSYDLLAEEQRTIFRRLAVFTGGWPDGAPAVVCAGPDEAPVDVQAGLRVLRDVHLIELGPDGRDRMLETIREFAADCLADSGEEARIRRRHADYFLAQAEARAPYVPLTRRGEWLERVDRDDANYQRALVWLDAQGDLTDSARLAGALWPYWHESWRLRNGWQWLERCLARTNDGLDLPPELQAQLLAGAAMIARIMGDFVRAATYAQRGLTLFEALGDRHGVALMRYASGWLSYALGDPSAGALHLRESIAEWTDLGNGAAIALCTNDLGLFLATDGQVAEAQPLLQRSYDVFARQEDRINLARSLSNRGLVALFADDLGMAVSLLSDSVDRCRSLGINFVLPGALFYLGTAQCFAGDLDGALSHLAEALRLQDESGDTFGLWLTLLGFAALAHHQGALQRAARLCGVVMAHQEGAGSRMGAATRMIYEREVGSVATLLGPADFDAEFTAGQEMTLAEAIDYALEAASLTPDSTLSIDG